MRTFGTLVVQNEGDIIEELLDSLRALDVFDAIFFYDLGSDDDTFRKALRYGDLLHQPRVVAEPYSETLRQRLMLEHRELYRPGDWLALIDADEFYEEDPRELIPIAEREGADSISTFQAEFQFTDRDLAAFDTEDPTQPIRARRRYYAIDWTEPRFFRYFGDWQRWPRRANPCSRRFLNRHYQYRTPEQIQRRIETRIMARNRTDGRPDQFKWPQVFSDSWRDYVAPHRFWHFDDGNGLRFGFPPGVLVSDLRGDTPETDRLRRLQGRMVIQCEELRNAAEPDLAPIRLVRLGIEHARAGVSFNPQPSGESALWLVAEDATPGTVVVMDSVPLVTALGEDGILTALVPEGLCERPGRYVIHLQRRQQRSNALEFVVEP
jgi:glycosyltransferase involved in cell wall biosynthesis